MEYMGPYTGVGTCPGHTYTLFLVSLIMSRWVYIANEMHTTHNIIRNMVSIYIFIDEDSESDVYHMHLYMTKPITSPLVARKSL